MAEPVEQDRQGKKPGKRRIKQGLSQNGHARTFAAHFADLSFGFGKLQRQGEDHQKGQGADPKGPAQAQQRQAPEGGHDGAGAQAEGGS